MRIHPSVRQWAVSFVSVDLIFWALLGFGCVTDPVSCFEALSFAPLFYFPAFGALPESSFLLSFLGTLGPVGVTLVVTALGVLAHALVGAGVGWVLRKREVPWLLSVVVSSAVVFGFTYATAYYAFRAETARETAVAPPTRSEIAWTDWETYTDVQSRFDFNFSPYMAQTPSRDPYNQLTDVIVAYSTDRSAYQAVNYTQSAWFVVSSQPISEAACYEPINGGQLAFAEEATIGATAFKVARATDAGAGNRYEQTLYRTYLNATCFEIATTLHYASDFTDIDEEAMNASQDEIRMMFEDMVQTFRFGL